MTSLASVDGKVFFTTSGASRGIRKKPANRPRRAAGTDGAEEIPQTSIGRLRVVSSLCSAGKPLNDALAHWLGSAVDAFLRGKSRTLEKALGLGYGRGGMPWRREEANRKRDAELRDLAEKFFAGEKPCVRSREIALISRNYAGSAWRNDRNRADMPSYYEGTPKAYLWRAFRSGANMPLGERQVRNIVG